MKEHFWTYKINDSKVLVGYFDELPLWSATFGLFLLENLPRGEFSQVLDLGPGTGFPTLELAGRWGEKCRITGLDPWENAISRAKEKAEFYGLSNTSFVLGAAEKMPFRARQFDLIVSNLGINNFAVPETAVAECYRVLRNNGTIAFTTNVNGHWKEFFLVFEQLLKKNKMNEAVSKLRQQQTHRGSKTVYRKLLSDAGFKKIKFAERNTSMRFLNGTAFLNHHFVKLGWMESWASLLPPEFRKKIFPELENSLNNLAKQKGELKLTVPMLYIQANKN
jgi:ubiquinone/menaquinone biosynthesis C-methylase UbiE